MKKYGEAPKRKEPGLLGKSIGSLIAFVAWMFMGLVISILIEWVGIKWYWPEQGARHSRDMVMTEYRYLNHQVKADASAYQYQSIIIDTFNSFVKKIETSESMSRIKQMTSETTGSDSGRFKVWVNKIVHEYVDYAYSTFYITQRFLIRMSIILLSLTMFALFAMVGIADGLTERELRRWGAGRESSTMFSLAKGIVFPTLIFACVLYICFPITIHPVLIMLPFGAMFGFSLKVLFEKLKKYF
jgi:integrating conjugative element membrane protein (TIGR03747 family)